MFLIFCTCILEIVTAYHTGFLLDKYLHELSSDKSIDMFWNSQTAFQSNMHVVSILKLNVMRI